MKKFNITVNGNVYEVEVEEVSANSAPAAVKAAPIPVAAPVVQAAAPAKEEAPAPAASGSQGAKKATAPMPGTVLKILVEIGQKISEGDAICILESMKMENEIPSPGGGVISSIDVQSGANVNAGDVLVTFN